jgi:hypothetical protein
MCNLFENTASFADRVRAFGGCASGGQDQARGRSRLVPALPLFGGAP